MKSLALLLCICLLLIVSGCDISRHKNYYEGYVYNTTGLPLEGVKVSEITTSPLVAETDKNGYFKLKRNPHIICNLRFEKEGYDTATELTCQERKLFGILNITERRYRFITHIDHVILEATSSDTIE